MSIADVSQQISDIQGRLALLSPTATSVDGGAGFATALSGATATAGASPVGSTLPSAGGVTGDDVVKAALQYEGVPYVLGGESKSGIDCSGLVQASFKSLGVDVPRLVHQQQTIGQSVPSLKDAKPGDLIVLDGGDHIAIWMGDGKAIHAPYPGRTVSVQKAWFDDSDITTIRRVVPATADATSGAVSALGASTAGLSATGMAQASALVGMYGTATGDSGSGALTSMLGASGAGGSLPDLLSTYGAGGSSGTAQQLLAARAALVGS